MVMSYVFTGMVALSVLFAILTGRGSVLSGAVSQGAAAGVTLAVSLSGSMVLWSGIGHLSEKSGLSTALSRLMRPLLCRIFPEARHDAALLASLSGNVCANLLGLGNAATPLGIQSARRLSRYTPGTAGDSLCRLIVLNTASIQLIPANVAAVRASLGCGTPFDILPAVWISSLLSAAGGLISAVLLSKIWPS